MEQFDFAIQAMVIGFSVVLFTLFALYCILLLFSSLFYKAKHKNEADQKVGRTVLQEHERINKEQRVIAAVLIAVYQYMQIAKTCAKSGPVKVTVQHGGKQHRHRWFIVERNSTHKSRLDLEIFRRKKLRENI